MCCEPGQLPTTVDFHPDGNDNPAYQPGDNSVESPPKRALTGYNNQLEEDKDVQENSNVRRDYWCKLTRRGIKEHNDAPSITSFSLAADLTLSHPCHP